MSRSGSRLELLKGPFVYGVVIVMATFLYWRRLAAVSNFVTLSDPEGRNPLLLILFSPFLGLFNRFPTSLSIIAVCCMLAKNIIHLQVVAISCLCAGDGFADLVGRRFGQKHRIPW